MKHLHPPVKTVHDEDPIGSVDVQAGGELKVAQGGAFSPK